MNAQPPTAPVADRNDLLFTFENSFVDDVPELSISAAPLPVPTPTILALNTALAADLGIDVDRLGSPEGAAVLAGSEVPDNSNPVAMAYAGHQFGGYSPRLGDGRAVLLGELVDGDGRRFDLHLKGSGRTPFSRGGDGKAVVGPMLREFLFAEAMHALGIPTGRALAVVGTGEQVIREGYLPGAVLARVQSSHLRVGTFEYTVRLDDIDVLRRLADHAISRHYPELAALEDSYVGLLEAVTDAQASLVAQWMLVGFVHGVMNTDNVTIAGETIDYGPCAFMDRFDPATVFSSIDRDGRYAYGNQPSITQWNLTRLAETLIPLLGDDVDAAIEQVKAVLDSFGDRFMAYWTAGMRSKFGLVGETDAEQDLFSEWLGMLHEHRVDYTGSYRALAASLRGDRAPLDALFDGTTDLDGWIERWHAALGPSADLAAVADGMDAVNPVYIPRNHLVDHALKAAEGGDTGPFVDLLAAVTNPYVDDPSRAAFGLPAPDEFNANFQTFCGT